MSYTIDQLWLDGGTDYTMLSSRNLSLLDGKKLLFGNGKDGEIYSSSDDLYIRNITSNKDIIFSILDGAAQTTVMVIDGDVSRVAIGGDTSALSTLHVGAAMVTAIALAPTMAVHGSVDGQYVAMSLINNQISAGGSANETVAIEMSWRDSGTGTSLGNLIIAGKEGDYTSGANADSFFALNTTLNNSRTEKLRLTSDGRLGIHTNAPAAKLHIEQSNNSGGIPVLTLDQADVSEQFLKLIGSSTTDNTQSLVDAANLATPGSIVGWFKTYVEDVQATNPITGGDYWVPFYNTPTS